jgi:hypothetical protein
MANNNPDEHGDQPNKKIGEGRHPRRRLWPNCPDHRTKHHAGENLQRFVLIERSTGIARCPLHYWHHSFPGLWNAKARFQ